MSYSQFSPRRKLEILKRTHTTTRFLVYKISTSGISDFEYYDKKALLVLR